MILSAFAAALVAASSPTAATRMLATPAASSAQQPTDVGGASARPEQPTRYCIDGERTGSRMKRRTCHTRAEWLERGFDPLEKE